MLTRIIKFVKKFLVSECYETQLREKIDTLTEAAVSAKADGDRKTHDEAMTLCYLFQLELEDVVRTKRQFEHEMDRSKRYQWRQNAIRKAQKFSRGVR